VVLHYTPSIWILEVLYDKLGIMAIPVLWKSGPGVPTWVTIAAKNFLFLYQTV
jgi:hypothetical protein